ncbi:hypothetical protein B566_EDAN007544 [Ephemera danica]|nr:hypothetical protein B566_EDAN007544 [Ephemera danica]
MLTMWQSFFVCAALFALFGTDLGCGLRINGVLVPRRTREAIMSNIVFPNSNKQPNEAENEVDEGIPMSMDIINRINEMDNNERKEFLKPFKNSSASTSEIFKEVGVDLDTVQRKGEKPTAAGCKPEMTIVPLRQTMDRSLLSWPKCTHVDMAVLRNGRLTAAPRKQIVPIVEHVTCKCSCTIQPEDCTDNQEYVKDDCYCRCKNQKDRVSCPAEKIWDVTTCSCACRDVTDCSTGEYFDYNTCRCRIELLLTRFGGISNRITPNRPRIDANGSNLFNNSHFHGFQ